MPFFNVSCSLVHTHTHTHTRAHTHTQTHTCTHVHTHKQHTILQIKESEEESSSSSGDSSPCHITSQPVSTGEPQWKRFRHLDHVLEQKWKEGIKKKSKLPRGQV